MWCKVARRVVREAGPWGRRWCHEAGAPPPPSPSPSPLHIDVSQLGTREKEREGPQWEPKAKIAAMWAAGSKANGRFSGINRPTAGAREEKAVPEGRAPVQLYSLATPNGQKASIALEELGVEYDAHKVSIMQGEQFTSGFVGVNPNSKIPCAVDKEGAGDGNPVHLWESASIVVYFADKVGRLIPPPSQPAKRAEAMNWIFWQMGGQGPLTGQFGHFYAYAPKEEVGAREYGVSRYGMEVLRLCDVLDKHLATRKYILGDEYSVADICCFPWVAGLLKGGYKYGEQNCADFLDLVQFRNMKAWHDRVMDRPAVQKGMQVCGWD